MSCKSEGFQQEETTKKFSLAQIKWVEQLMDQMELNDPWFWKLSGKVLRTLKSFKNKLREGFQDLCLEHSWKTHMPMIPDEVGKEKL